MNTIMESKKTLADKLREATGKLKSLSVTDPLEKKMADIVSRATSEMWINPDWALNMELVDMINTNSGDQTNEKAFRCIKRRLSCRDAKVQFLTLTLLETLVKNCGATFQSALSRSDLWTEVASIAEPKRKTDLQVLDKVLIMVEDFSLTLRPQRYQDTFNTLQSQGVRFPKRSVGEVGAGMADLQPCSGAPRAADNGVSPEDSAAIQAALRDLEGGCSVTQDNQRAILQRAPSQGLGLLSTRMHDTEIARNSKLMEDLNVVHNSVDLLEEALKSIPDDKREEVNQDFIKDLAEQCIPVRPKLANLIQQTDIDEKVMEQALTIYEDLDRALNMFDELIAKVAQGPVEPRQTNQSSVPANSTPEYDLLGSFEGMGGGVPLQSRHIDSGALSLGQGPTQSEAAAPLALDGSQPASRDEFAMLAVRDATTVDGFDALALGAGTQSAIEEGAASQGLPQQVNSGQNVHRSSVSAWPPRNVEAPTLPPPPPTSNADQLGDLISF